MGNEIVPYVVLTDTKKPAVHRFCAARYGAEDITTCYRHMGVTSRW